MTVASEMIKGFFKAGDIRVGDTINRATSGQLDDTIAKSATINTSNIDTPVEGAPLEVANTPDDFNATRAAETLTDPAVPVNRERTTADNYDGRNFNLSNATDADEVFQIIDNVSLSNEGFKKAKGGGPQPHSDVINKAKKSDIAELEKVIGYKLGDGVTPERVYKARQLLQESAFNLKNMADTIMAGQANDAFKLRFRQAIASHVGVQQAVAGMATESGRSLNAWRIPVGSQTSSKSTIFRGQLQDMIEKAGGNESINKLARAILAFDDLDKITRAAEKLHFATKMDMFLEVRVNGLLSGPQTHVVNSGSNALVATWSIPERFLAAGIGKMLRTKDGVAFGETVAQMYGIIYGVRDGWRLAAKTARTGEPTDPMMKIEARRYNAVSSANINNQLPASMQFKPEGAIAKGIDLFGDYVVRLPTKLLTAEDEFFKTINYRMELHALAYRTAKNEGLEGKNFSNRVHDLLENPTEEIHLGANDFARLNTFTNELGETGKQAQNLINRVPVYKIIAPFVRTPTNIVKYVFNRLPPTPFTKTMNADLAAGGVKRDMALARISLGSLTMGSMASFAMEGRLTGAGPNNYEARRALQLTGWQPYSVFHKGKYYSYKRTDPIGMFLGMAADVVDAGRYAESGDYTDVAMASIVALTKNLNDKTYMSGVADAIQALEDPDRYMENWLKRTAVSFVPYTTLSGTVERTKDPTLRMANTFLEKVRAKTPYFSEDLPPRRNLWGDPVVLQGTWGWDMVSPIYVSDNVDDPVANELVNQSVGVKKQTTKIGNGLYSVELTLQEADRLALLTGKEVKIGGRNLHQHLAFVIKTSSYKNKTNGPEGRKNVKLAGIISEFKARALKRLLKENEALRERLKEQEYKKKFNLTGNEKYNLGTE